MLNFYAFFEHFKKTKPLINFYPVSDRAVKDDDILWVWHGEHINLSRERIFAATLDFPC